MSKVAQLGKNSNLSSVLPFFTLTHSSSFVTFDTDELFVVRAACLPPSKQCERRVLISAPCWVTACPMNNLERERLFVGFCVSLWVPVRRGAGAGSLPPLMLHRRPRVLRRLHNFSIELVDSHRQRKRGCASPDTWWMRPKRWSTSASNRLTDWRARWTFKNRTTESWLLCVVHFAPTAEMRIYYKCDWKRFSQ